MAFVVSANTNNPYINLALEEKLCAFARDNDAPLLYLWQNSLCCVIGVNQNPWLECNTEEMEACGALLVRRKTGGGAVCHDLGNLNFSFCYPENGFDTKDGNSVILSALSSLGIEAEASGRNDLCISGKKFSGSAFRRAEGFSLHHGTLLVSSELSLFPKLLTPDSEKLKAKGVRSVSSRVTNLSDFCPGLTVNKIKTAVETAFSEKFGECAKLDPQSFDVAAEAQAYASPLFRYGRTPKFSENISFRLPSCGINAGLEVEKGVVRSCRIWTDSLDVTLPSRLEAAVIGKQYSPELVKEEAEKLIKTI